VGITWNGVKSVARQRLVSLPEAQHRRIVKCPTAIRNGFSKLPSRRNSPQFLLAAYFSGTERHRSRQAKGRRSTVAHEGNVMKISPLAGKLAPSGILVNVPRLLTPTIRRPRTLPYRNTGGVWHLWASRFVVEAGFQRMAHPRDHPAICLYRKRQKSPARYIWASTPRAFRSGLRHRAGGAGGKRRRGDARRRRRITPTP